jgi:isopentenyldiphosphate isomerase
MYPRVKGRCVAMTIPHPTPTEFFDIVDANDQPTGQVLTRADAYQQKARFRVIHLYLFSADYAYVYLQQRSTYKTFAPSCWSATVVGHVSAGETWLEAAQREMQEELSLNLPLHFLSAHDWFDTQHAQQYFMNGVLWGILPDTIQFKLATDEVADFKAVALADMAQWLAPSTLQHPAFASTWRILEKHLPYLQPKPVAQAHKHSDQAQNNK